ncbi:hypothetical protein EYC84_006500 [Monilinia fructicola]|uniref:Acyl-CoA thioesterase-like N-terminal HotDog domain-containing protein n=1 Tax=Monilinia fructicola TaxID=38448 RepID=A0A5M9K6A3_MONFR|nr:hypothetical protein EYC84_006500 [Monilinia fructicola]
MTTPPSSNTGTNFTDATKVEQLTSHTYSANFPDDWCIGSVPHGGFITAVFLQVSTLHFSTTLRTQNQPNPIALHLEFLRRTQTGPALFTVQDTKLGRQASVLHITLSQGDRVEVVGYITHSNTSTETGVSSPHTHVLHPTPLPVSIPRLKNQHRPQLPPPKHALLQIPQSHHKIPNLLPQKPNPHPPFPMNGSGFPPANSGPPPVSATPATCSHSPPTSSPPPLPHRPTPPPQPNTPTRAPNIGSPTLLLNIDFKKTLPAQGVEWLFIRVERKQTKNVEWISR